MATVLNGGSKQSGKKFKSKFKLGLKILYKFVGSIPREHMYWQKNV